MATLERIRRRSGLLIIVIGLAMLGFILTDLLSSGNSILRGETQQVVRVDGVSLDQQEFNQRVSERIALLQRQNPQQYADISRVLVANQIYQEFLQEQIMQERYEGLGIEVTDEEFINKIKNNPQIRNQQSFKDPVTGRFSLSAFQNYVEELRDQANNDEQSAMLYQQWIGFEEATLDQALNQKYLNAVRKGVYVPTALAKQVYEMRNTGHNVQYFGMEYNSIADSVVSVEESDLRRYYREHKEEYKNDRTADIAYVTFRVEPSQRDRSTLKQELRSYLKPEIIKSRGKVDTFPSFYETDDDSIFAVGRTDASQVLGDYLTEDQLDAPLDSILLNADTGYIHGPYEQGSDFVLSKVSDIKMIPDSVKARHILISFQGANQGQSQSQRPGQEAQALADSLYQRFKEDTTGFAQTAKELSDDPGSGSRGGNLGWFDRSTMVRPFSQFSFRNEPGDVGLVFSQFGFHIIHIQEQAGENKAVKLTEIRRNILPSDATRDSVYERAQQFAASADTAENFAAVATAAGYSVRPVTDLEPMQEQILGIGNNRQIVQWAFNEEESEIGDIDLVNHQNESWIVVKLTDRRDEGLANFEAVQDQVRRKVVNEKKAEMLKEQLNEKSAENIEAWAQALNLKLNSANLNFQSSNLTGFGSEPEVVGKALAMEAQQVSDPIAGDRGVYVIKVLSESPAPAVNDDYQSEQVRIVTEQANLAAQQAFESLKEDADIKDNRARFF